MCKSFVYMVRVDGTVWTVTNIEKIKDRLLTFGEAQCSREEEKKPLRNLKDYRGYAAMSQVHMVKLEREQLIHS